MNATGQPAGVSLNYNTAFNSKRSEAMDKAPMVKDHTRPSFPKRMASFIYEYFQRSYEESNANAIKTYPTPGAEMEADRHPSDEIVGGTTFRLISCDGGLLVVTKYVDTNDFSVRTRCYVIPNGENVGERLETIFGFESLKGS